MVSGGFRSDSDFLGAARRSDTTSEVMFLNNRLHILKAISFKSVQFQCIFRDFSPGIFQGFFLPDRDFSRDFFYKLSYSKGNSLQKCSYLGYFQGFSPGIFLGIFWCVSKFARDFFKTCQKIPSVFKKIPRDFLKPIGIFQRTQKDPQGFSKNL